MAADKEEIRSRSDIVEIVGGYVPLQKRGRNWMALCPFHQEKTASFHVDPVTQTFKCFGCGASGDVFTFVERYENMDFVEAAELLARRAGLTLARLGRTRPTDERDKLYEANSVALDYFRLCLGRVEIARSYLDRRGLAPDTVSTFKLGYAPESWDSLVGHLRTKRIDLRIAMTAGLLHPGKTSDYYDAFRNRVIFPIHDEQERIVGFGGRAMGDEQPKYLNTGETPIFAKSRLLYGLHWARRRIAALGQTLLMEGYTDVIAAHQAGFMNAVATLGTALTEEHAKKLARLAPRVGLVYDADSAGIKATLRASEILEKAGLQVGVVALPAGEDPDSLLRSGGSDVFQRAIDEAVGRVEYQLVRIIAEADQSTEHGKQRMLAMIVAVLGSVATRAERDLYIERVWRYHPMSAHGPAIAKEQLHRDAESLANRRRPDGPVALQPAQSVTTYPRQPAFQRRDESSRTWVRDKSGEGWRRNETRRRPAISEPPPTVQPGPTTEARAERQLLRALASPDWRRTALSSCSLDDLVSVDAREFRRLVEAVPVAADEAELVARVREHPDAMFSDRMLALLQEFGIDAVNEPMTSALLNDCIGLLRRTRQKRVMAEITELLQGKQVLTEEDQERVRELHALLRTLKGTPEPTEP